MSFTTGTAELFVFSFRAQRQASPFLMVNRHTAVFPQTVIMCGLQESTQHEQSVSKVQAMSMLKKNVASCRQKTEGRQQTA